MDSIPVVALTGQVSTSLIGTDAFQEADTFGLTRSATKHNFMVKTLAELPQIVHEAFYLAASGRPGPVLVDVPKDVFIGAASTSPSSRSICRDTRSDGRPQRPDPPRRADDLGSRASDDLCGRRHRSRQCVKRASRTGRNGRFCRLSAR